MSNLQRMRMSIPLRTVQIKETPPIFLAPILACPYVSTNHRSHFSTSAPSCGRERRDGNPNRGLSALRRTGLRYPVGMSKVPLPEPVLNPKMRSKVTVDEKHGLWGFFNKARTLLSTPEEDNAHGMSLVCLELGLNLIDLDYRATLVC